jgi:hypothetical protein
MYLISVKEENIAKKMLLDICFKELKDGLSMFDVEESDPIIKKIKTKFIGQSNKYPSNGPHLDGGEIVKLNKFMDDYHKLKCDLTYTNLIL